MKADFIMKAKVSYAILVSSILFTSGVHAGSNSSQQVLFFTTNGLKSAKGVLSEARYSSDAKQFIGCSTYAYDTGSHSIVCNATNASGEYLGCSSNKEEMIAIAQNLNPASYLYFVVNTDGSCDRVISVNSSYNLQ